MKNKKTSKFPLFIFFMNCFVLYSVFSEIVAAVGDYLTHGKLEILLSSLLFKMGFLLVYYWGTKLAIYLILPDEMEFVPANLEEYPKLDISLLQQYTLELENLGFTKTLDYTIKTKKGKVYPAIARLFYHPQHHCIAEVNQLFPVKGTSLPVGCVLSSFIEDGWSFSSTDREPDGISYIMRRPKSLGTTHPDTFPVNLLDLHISRRKEIIEKLQLPLVTNVSPYQYFINEQNENKNRKRALLKKNLFIGIAEAALFSIKPKYEWVGELPKGVLQKKA